MRFRRLFGLLLVAPLFAACSEDRECVTDGDCASGGVCSPQGVCLNSSDPISRDFGPPIDFGPIVLPDLGDTGPDMADMGADEDMGPEEDMGAEDMGSEDMGSEDMGGGGGTVGPIVPVPDLTVLTQDVILEVERRSLAGTGTLVATAGVRVEPGSRSCNETVSPAMMGANGQQCIIVQRDCDGPGTGLATGGASHRFAVGANPPRSFGQGVSSTNPTWLFRTLNLNPLFTSPAGVSLETSIAGGGAGGLMAVPSTTIPTPPDFRIQTPNPGVQGSLDVTLVNGFTFNTSSGQGRDVFFEIYDEERTRILRCEGPFGTFFPFDPGILQSYRDTINPMADPTFFAEVGFEEAVTREVPIAGGGMVEVAFSFQWVAQYTQVGGL